MKSREEAEAEEVAAMLRFKARPISRAVLGGARRTSTRPKVGGGGRGGGLGRVPERSGGVEYCFQPTPPAPRVLQDPVRSWNGSLTVPHPFALNTEVGREGGQENGPGVLEAGGLSLGLRGCSGARR